MGLIFTLGETSIYNLTVLYLNIYNFHMRDQFTILYLEVYVYFTQLPACATGALEPLLGQR